MRDESLFDASAPLVVQRLGHHLGGLPESLREHYLHQHLEDAPLKPLTRIVACAIRTSARGEIEGQVFLDVLSTWIAGRGATVVEALRAAATELEESSVTYLLDDAARPTSARSDEPPRGSLAATGETLGRRRTLARVVSGDDLDRILLDVDPIVIRNALMNPRINELLVVRLAARRPVPPAVLEEIARSKFRNRPMVRRALVFNRECPTRLATQLLARMARADLVEVANDAGTPQSTRDVARELLASKMG